MTDEDAIRAGVVGVGSMGENHVSAYDELPETTVAGVYDADADRAQAVADEYDTQAYGLEDLLDEVDLVSIAVPTPYHYETAVTCVDAGVHVLVEKPFVDDVGAGRDLVAQAESLGVTVAVGHVERFNPVVDVVRDLVEGREIVSLSAGRVAPPPERDIPDSVVLDLMIHDVDVACSLIDGDVVDCDAHGARDGEYATATLSFDSGADARLTASRIARRTRRELTVTTPNRRITADYREGTVELRRAPEAEVPAVPDGGAPRDTSVERVPVPDRDPLETELRSFVEAAITGTSPPVSGADGLAVLDVVQELNRAAGNGAGGGGPP